MAGVTLRAAAHLLARRSLEVEAQGLEHIPATGPVLLVARHYHHLYDGVVLLRAVSRPTHILVALDWVETAALRWVMEWATRTARWPAVLRPEGMTRGRSAFAASEMVRQQLHAMREAVALLHDGAALVVFPEGFPTLDPRFTPKRGAGEYLPFHTGFARIAAMATRRSGAPIPVVPVGLRYRPDRRWRVSVRFGSPMVVTKDARAAARAVQSRVMALSAAP